MTCKHVGDEPQVATTTPTSTTKKKSKAKSKKKHPAAAREAKEEAKEETKEEHKGSGDEMQKAIMNGSSSKNQSSLAASLPPVDKADLEGKRKANGHANGIPDPAVAAVDSSVRKRKSAEATPEAVTDKADTHSPHKKAKIAAPTTQQQQQQKDKTSYGVVMSEWPGNPVKPA